jgi:hypothetical protein
MSRELWLGGAFAVLAAGSLLVEDRRLRVLAAGAAVALALAQGQILRQARAVAVWAIPPVPAVFLTSALVSGAGLLTALEAWSGRPVDRLLGGGLALLIAHGWAWSLLVTWSRDEPFRRSARPLREGLGLAVAVAGSGLPWLLGALAVAKPPWGPALAAAAGLLMVAGQAGAKGLLIRQAGQLRPIELALPPLPRRSP